MCHITLLSNSMELFMLSLDILSMYLTMYNSDNLLDFHQRISDIIMINLMCYMTLLSNPMELSMLSLNKLYMDHTLYNSEMNFSSFIIAFLTLS
jgi:hypothetical protein